MILFVLGIIVGLILAILWLLSVPKLPEPQKVIETVKKTFEPKKTGAIIQAPSDDFYALQSKFKQADQDKEDIALDDLLK